MKVTKKTTKAIIFFWDEETQLPRRIVYGNPETLVGFLASCSQITLDRLIDIVGKNPKDREAMKKAIQETRYDDVLIHAEGAFEEKDKITISYEIPENDTL